MDEVEDSYVTCLKVVEKHRIKEVSCKAGSEDEGKELKKYLGEKYFKE